MKKIIFVYRNLDNLQDFLILIPSLLNLPNITTITIGLIVCKTDKEAGEKAEEIYGMNESNLLEENELFVLTEDIFIENRDKGYHNIVFSKGMNLAEFIEKMKTA